MFSFHPIRIILCVSGVILWGVSFSVGPKALPLLRAPVLPSVACPCFKQLPPELTPADDAGKPIPPPTWVVGVGGTVGSSVDGQGVYARFFESLVSLDFTPAFILDVGANQGSWAHEARAAFARVGSTILCVEGSPQHAGTLQNQGFTYVISLVAARQGWVSYYDSSDTHTGNSIMKEKTDFFLRQEATRTPTRTLDELIAAYAAGVGHPVQPQLLKLDVQGYELEALKGATQLLAGVEVVLLETSVLQYNVGSPLAGEVIAALDCLGFQVLDLVELHFKRELLLQIDVAFVRKGSYLIDRAHFSANLINP